MSYSLRIITPPPYEPLSFAEAQKYLNLDDDQVDDDDVVAEINAFISAAREWLESYTGTTLIRTSYEMQLDAWPGDGVLELPRSPLISVDSIGYVDGAGVTQTWDAANYDTDLYTVPGRIRLAYGGSWPSSGSFSYNMRPWRVRFTAGHAVGSPADEDAYREAVPAMSKLAMKVHVSGSHEGNLHEVLAACESIARPLRTEIL